MVLLACPAYQVDLTVIVIIIVVVVDLLDVSLFAVAMDVMDTVKPLFIILIIVSVRRRLLIGESPTMVVSAHALFFLFLVQVNRSSLVVRRLVPRERSCRDFAVPVIGV